jgi:hypothetical protein
MRRLLVLALALAGCGGLETGDDIEVRSSALAPPPVDFVDSTQTLRVRVKTCDWTPAATTNCAYCSLDLGWARVGGGAEIQGEPAPVGARIQGSYPSANSFDPDECTGGPWQTDVHWVARSAGGVAHSLRAYIIEMQIRDTPSGTWEAPPVSSPIDATTSLPTAPVTGVSRDCLESDGGWDVPGVHPIPLMVGGGAEIVGGITNTYLRESYPFVTGGKTAWRATTRSTTARTDVAVKCYKIAIERCPWQWNGDCFSYPTILSSTGTPSDGYGTTSLSITDTWRRPTAVGGRATESGSAGRYLADQIPLNGSNAGFVIRSYREAAAANGNTSGYALALGRGAPYTMNTVRFNHNGTALKRVSNPTRLAQSDMSDDSATSTAHRWHLELVGVGSSNERHYRLKNGNPDTGTSCARRLSGTTDIRVESCGTSNDFKWRAIPDVTAGVFQLQNVSTGQCIDNADQGFVDGAVTLTSCGSGYDTSQAFFLDRYFGWPAEWQ